jgi:hypothetical protein
MKYFLLTILLPLALSLSAKESLSYLYIQGDKQTPFYVKLEDAMQPRFGKNYCIVPQLASGPTHIEILFQQNAFPAQQFTVLIPESGSRGFLLVKKDEGFALYDLQQGFYLPAGNTEADDHLPAGVAVAVNTPLPSANPETSVPKPKPASASRITKKEKPERKSTIKPKVAVVKPQPIVKKGPDFIPDMELPKATEPGTDNSTTPSTVALPAAIVNSDCPSAISSTEFGKIFNAMSANTGDEERLSYALGKMDLCYESWQARTLAQMLGGDAARFTLLKKIYPRIADQAAFPLLDDLLTAETWKAEFAQLVRHQ